MQNLPARPAKFNLAELPKPSAVVPSWRLKLYSNCTTRLGSIVDWAAKDCDTASEVAHKWVKFLRQTALRACTSPTDSRGEMVVHPLYLLESRWMLCGQVARLVVDGLSTRGIPARVLQLNGHVSAEYFVDGAWIFAEGDLFNVDQHVSNETGNLLGLDSPGFMDALLASLAPYSRPTCHKLFGISKGDWSKHSVAELEGHWTRIFSPTEYEVLPGVFLRTPYTFSKITTSQVWDRSRFYGWDRIEYTPRMDSA